MPIHYHSFFPSILLIFALLPRLRLAASQTATVSSLPASPTSSVLPDYSFTYPKFLDRYGTGIQVSYKDTIDVSWVANGAQPDPVLQIVCWDRNDSSSFVYTQNPSSYIHDLTTSSTPSLALYPLALTPYKQYSPCQLRLKEPHDDDDGELVVSVGIFISDKTNASTAGVTWNADDPAPKVPIDAGVAVTASGSARTKHPGVIGEGIWAVAGAVAAAVLLL